MRKSLLSRLAPFLFAAYALGFAACAAYAFFTYSVSAYLPGMRIEFIIKRAFVLFVDYLIPLHAAAVAVAASLAGREPARTAGPAQPFSQIVSSALVAFLLLTVAYTALYEGLYPRARARLSDMRYQTQLARAYKKQAASRAAAGDFTAARDAADRYLAIDPTNAQMIAERAAAETKATRQKASTVATGATPSADDAHALVEKARAALDQRDWYHAHYYAQSAAAIDPRRADAQLLASQAWEHIVAESKGMGASELFLRKKAAYTLLVGGDALAAYYSFVELAAAYPKDPDVATYLAEAREKLKSATFFLNAARAMEGLPGSQGILFLNRTDAEYTEAVYFGTMVETAGGDVFFFDIEAIRYSAAGAVLWHFTAPYGMRQPNNSVLMRCIDQTDRTVQYVPTYLRGSRPDPDRNLLVVKPSVEELRALSTRRDSLSVMGIADLWRLRNDLGAHGMTRQAITVEMTMRMVMPFAFLILSVLCVALGWAFRTRYPGKLPFGNILLLPLVPVVMALFALLYLYAHRIVIGFVVLASGFGVALAVIGALQVALLAAALVLMAGQSSK
jgi:hypothetical protein